MKSRAPLGVGNLRFSSPQLDTSSHCENLNTGHCVMCQFMAEPLAQYNTILTRVPSGHPCSRPVNTANEDLWTVNTSCVNQTLQKGAQV